MDGRVRHDEALAPGLRGIDPVFEALLREHRQVARSSLDLAFRQHRLQPARAAHTREPFCRLHD
jgi:hypothetical protein